MTHTFELKFLKYWAIAKVSFSHATTYTGDVISLGLLAVIRLWVLTQMYLLAYSSQSLTQIGGFTPAMTIWSLAFANSFQLGLSSRMIVQPITEDIQSGNIAYTLNKPYSFLAYLYFSNIGRLVARLMPTLFIAVGITWTLVGPIEFSINALLAGVLLAVLGLSLNLLLVFIVAILGFWVEEVKPYRWILDRMQWIIGGMIIPLTFFPDWLQKVAEVSPFALCYYAAARIFVGYQPALFAKYLIAQLFWLALAAVVLGVLFKRGIKNISINGG